LYKWWRIFLFIRNTTLTSGSLAYIWTGTSHFTPNANQTVWGYYDNDPTFVAHADKMAEFIVGKLGYPQYDVELDSGSLYACFEEAVTIYARELYNYQIRDNYYALLGTPSASFTSNQLVTPTLSNEIRLAKTYGSEIGVGGTISYYSGALPMSAHKQVYNLNEWATQSASLAPGDSIEIKKIYYREVPASMRWIDPTLGGGGQASMNVMNQFGFSGYPMSTSYMLMPLHMDALRIQQVELNDEIRRSHYGFELINNNLRIFPIPTEDRMLHFEYIKVSERNASGISTLPDGSITNPSQVPYGNITYSTINGPGRTFIAQYALALAMDKLAFIRGLFGNTVPTPNDPTTLNAPDLQTFSTNLKSDLLTQIREFFAATSRKAQLEQRQAEADAANKTLANVPMQIYIG